MGHGVPCHNSLLQLFEPDKELVYLDQGALTIIEKLGFNINIEKTSKVNRERSAAEIEENYLNQIQEWQVRLCGDA